MERVTMTLEAGQLATLDAYAAKRGYASRSEALRDILREVETREVTNDPDAACMGVLSYVYEHETRELSRRLTSAQHDHHDLSVATLHVHVSHDDCLEVTVLKGPLAAIRRFADEIVTQRGVRAGHLQVIPAIADDHHATGHGHGPKG